MMNTCVDTTDHRLVMNSEILVSKVMKTTSPIFQHIVYMYWEIFPHSPFQWPSCLGEPGVRMQNRCKYTCIQHLLKEYMRST